MSAVAKAEIEAAPVEQRKQRALDDFLSRLLKDEVREHIASIVLFGSVAEGEAREESDIDLLVFGTDRLEALSEACAAASFETAVEWGESVEALVYGSHDLRFPSSYFLFDALQRGKEIYRMDKETLRRKEAEAALGLAREYLRSAENALANGFYRLALDAAYNSSALCAKGLLLLKLDRMPKTHGGLVQMFGKLYVRTGLIAAEFGQKLNQHLELRNKARYDFHARIVRDDAQEAIELAKAMTEFLEEALEGQGPQGER